MCKDENTQNELLKQSYATLLFHKTSVRLFSIHVWKWVLLITSLLRMTNKHKKEIGTINHDVIHMPVILSKVCLLTKYAFKLLHLNKRADNELWKLQNMVFVPLLGYCITCLYYLYYFKVSFSPKDYASALEYFMNLQEKFSKHPTWLCHLLKLTFLNNHQQSS